MFHIHSLPPDPSLNDYVHSYHFVSTAFSVPFIESNVLPQVFQSLSFNLGERRDILDTRNNKFLADNAMIGPNDCIYRIRVNRGMKRLVINLKFSGWYKLFNVPLEPFVNRSINLRNLLDGEISAFSLQLRACKDIWRQKELTDLFLRKQVMRPKKNSDNIDAAFRLIFESKGRAAIGEVANSAFMTRRTLERRFLEQTGLYPKMFSRIVRFNETIKFMAKRSCSHWAQLAKSLGYYDQSHFINDFQFFAGCPPNQFARRGSDLELPVNY